MCRVLEQASKKMYPVITAGGTRENFINFGAQRRRAAGRAVDLSVR
jgi:xylose isomerase